jgi:hypothetical protein
MSGTPLTNNETVDVLADLLNAERQSLLQRVAELDPFVPPEQARLAELVRQAYAQQQEHVEDLGSMMIELGATPRPISHVLDQYSQTAHLHYLRLDYLLPNLLDALEALLARYRTAAEKLAPDSAAGQLVRRIRQRWQEQIEILQHHAPPAANTA